MVIGVDEGVDLGARQLGKARQQPLDGNGSAIESALQHHRAPAAVAQHPGAHLRTQKQGYI